MAPFVIAIFIAHQGCPHRCIFCNQWSITGGMGKAGPMQSGDQVSAEIERQLAWPRKNTKSEVQVAFFGGSFTGLPLERQQELLRAVAPFIRDGRVQRIRLSTRPDYVDEQTGVFLKGYGVGIVELGVQSLTPAVLDACARGHTANQVEYAFTCLKSAGLTVGGQLMIGLPGETRKSTLRGVRRLSVLAPDFVRIYPALVLKGSKLAEMWAAGKYQPLELSEAVSLTVRIKEMLGQAGIRVVRMGLQPSVALEDDLLAGPYHPAFGDLVGSRILFKKVRAALAEARQARTDERSGPLCLSIAAADQSAFRGQKNTAIRRLNELGLLNEVKVVFSADQGRGTVFLMSDHK